MERAVLLFTWEIRGRELRCTSRGRAGGDDCWDIDQKFSNHDAFDSHIYCWKRRLLQLVGGGWCCCYCCWRWCYGCYYLRSPSLISSFLLFWFCLLKRRLLLAANISTNKRNSLKIFCVWFSRIQEKKREEKKKKKESKIPIVLPILW